MKTAVIVLQNADEALPQRIAESLNADIYRNQGKGELAQLAENLWERYEGLVFVMASGIVVRTIAPLIESKYRDPAVVVVDDAGRFSISLLSGHEGGANSLAWRVSSIIDAVPVITTGTETNRRHVIGIGCRRGISADEAKEAIQEAVASANLSADQIRCAATVQAKRDEEGLVRGLEELGIPLQFVDHRRINEFDGPYDHSDAAMRNIGVRAVAEPCALLVGRRSSLVLRRVTIGRCTVAIAREDSADPTPVTPDQHERSGAPMVDPSATRSGSLTVVGIGPGSPTLLTPAAREAITSADLVVGYKRYLQLISDLVGSKDQFSSGMRHEKERAQHAVDAARGGRAVVVVSSGDPGVYALAGLVLELLPAAGGVWPETRIVPGVTAANAAASLLGAPLMHDHVVISLSDLLTDWEVIKKRLALAGAGDFAVAIYNPKSRTRTTQLEEARQILLQHRAPETPVGVVTSAYREECEVFHCTLGTLGDHIDRVGMSSTVIVGNSTTFYASGWMVTPRGYEV